MSLLPSIHLLSTIPSSFFLNPSIYRISMLHPFFILHQFIFSPSLLTLDLPPSPLTLNLPPSIDSPPLLYSPSIHLFVEKKERKQKDFSLVSSSISTSAKIHEVWSKVIVILKLMTKRNCTCICKLSVDKIRIKQVRIYMHKKSRLAPSLCQPRRQC